MGSEARRTTHDPQAAVVCPACGSTLGVVARRHKVLGAWVPIWGARPCQNPDCELYEGATAGRDGRAVTENPAAPGPEAGEPGGAEATTTHVTGKNGETGRSPATG
ncbi:hypothetical protein [Streptomyces sp. NBC_01216]|uniref:hypothetical protein n=1 Tax=unclassified Streptomyces TaxID=2593676 RepID=UPI002E13EE8F|nr:hypothetical protein OG393_09635 [Streptomyces sp. NBC_01216]